MKIILNQYDVLKIVEKYFDSFLDSECCVEAMEDGKTVIVRDSCEDCTNCDDCELTEDVEY